MATKKTMKSGAQLRAFRRHLATRADRPSEKYTRTLKFPLEDTGFFNDPQDFQDATQLYNITEGIESNSLYGLLMHLHLGGFRLFSSATKAYTFSNRKVFGNADFKEALNKAFGVESKKLDAEAIYEDLKRPRRKTRGIVKELTGRGIADDYYKLATGKAVDVERDDFNKELHAFLKEFGDTIEQQLGSWQSVNEDISSDGGVALTCLDTVLANHGVDLPSIRERLNDLNEPSSELKKSTIAYDVDKEVVLEYPNEIALHIVVAQYLQDIESEEPTKSESVKYLQANITTETHSGLSWLLGKGM